MPALAAGTGVDSSVESPDLNTSISQFLQPENHHISRSGTEGIQTDNSSPLSYRRHLSFPTDLIRLSTRLIRLSTGSIFRVNDNK